MTVLVRTAEPMLTLKKRLELGSDFFIRTLKARQLFLSEENLAKNVIPVFVGEKQRIPSSAIPAIRVVPDSWNTQWLSTRVRDDQYRFYVDCMVRTSEADVVDEYIMVFALAAEEWLLEFSNLQGKINETRSAYYDSWVDSVQFGWSKGQVWRIARLTYWMKTQHAYVVPAGSSSNPC